MGAELSFQDRLKNALDTVANLQGFQAGVFPARPELLTYDDGQLVEAYQTREVGKVGKAAAEQLRIFAIWRSAIWRLEAKHEGALVALVAALSTLEASGEHASETKRLRTFIREQYRAAVTEPAPTNRYAVERWANARAMNRTLLPLHMRSMSRPPVGSGTSKSGVSVEDGQEFLDYGEEDPNEPSF
jgi:hypothetical protein